MVYNYYMTPLADTFFSIFDEWFTETFGEMNLAGNLQLYAINFV